MHIGARARVEWVRKVFLCTHEMLMSLMRGSKADAGTLLLAAGLEIGIRLVYISVVKTFMVRARVRSRGWGLLSAVSSLVPVSVSNDAKLLLLVVMT